MKIIKKLLLGVLILVLLVVVFIVLANTIFTNKLELSCAGEYVETLNGKVQSREKDLRAVQIQITQLPFQKQHVIASSGGILIISSDADRNTDAITTMTMANDVDVIAGSRYTTSNSTTFNAISLNRITKAVKIENNIKSLPNGDYREEVFTGICEPAKRL
jgi:hypothetical protein